MVEGFPADRRPGHPVGEVFPNQRLIASEYDDVEVSMRTRLVT
jgi:hypothetical protein